MKKNFIKGKVALASEGDKITIIASDETLDRHGEVIKADAWDLDNYKLSPRLLVDHDHTVESIVGKATNIRVEDGSLLFEPVFHEITELARMVKQMVIDGFLDTVSVGFIPHGPEKDGDTGRNELIEVSFVTVPANPKARVIRDLVGSIDDVQMLAVKEFIGETEKPKEEAKDDIVVTSAKVFNDVIQEYPETDVLLCEAQFLKDLVSEHEKHTTLIEENNKLKQVVASNYSTRHKMMRDAMKEATKIISHALYKAKVTKV